MGTPIAAFPSRIATAADLKVANNGIQTTLAGPIGTTDTTFKVSNGIGFAPNQLVSIDSEIITITGVSGTVLTVGQRGFDGTAAAAHVQNAPVRLLVDAWHHNSVATEVMAVENFLGVNGSNLTITLASSSYNFSPQAPGGSLVVGNNSIMLSPVPIGVNGSNTKHYLYISGGTGTAEAVLITGGSGTSGSPSGQIIVNCANTHSGSWTISSATMGIQEAEKTLPATGGTVYLSSGNLQMQAPISYQSNRTFQGYGNTTKIIPASWSAIVFDNNLVAHSTNTFNMVRDNIVFRDFVIDAHSYWTAGSPSTTNTCIGVRNLAQGNEFCSVNGMRFERVAFDNVRYAVYIQRAYDVSFYGVRTYATSQIYFVAPVATDATFHNYLLVFQDFGYFWNFMNGSPYQPTVFSGDAAIRIENGELCYISNSIFQCQGGSGSLSTDGICFAGGGEDLGISNVAMNNTRIGVNFIPLTFGATTYYPGYAKISNLSVDQIWSECVGMANGVDNANMWDNVHNVEITNSIFSNPHPSATTVYMLVIGNWSQYISVSNTQFVNLTNAYPQFGVSVGANAGYVVFDNNQITNSSGSPGGTGIYGDLTAGVYGMETTAISNMGSPINDGGANVATIASAATITLPVGRATVYVSGSANITGITAPLAERTTVTLAFIAGGLTVTGSGTLRLAGGTLVATAWTTLTLKYLNGAWVELSRSIK